MEITVNKGILHVINNDGGQSYCSTEELDFESESCSEFIQKHIKKLLDDPSSKEAVFNADSEFYHDVVALKNKEIYFKEFSVRVFERLSEIMQQHVDIPSADILVVQFGIKDREYVAILKLNYLECYTHKINKTDAGADNQIIKYASVLPFNSGKVEEACLIPFEPMVLKLLEKPHLVDGECIYYFSELFLDCTTEISKKEAAEIIDEVTNAINSKFFNQQVDTLAKVKNAILEEAEEGEGVVRLENVANRAFGENIEIRNEYVQLVRDQGLVKDLELGEKYIRKQFGFQKFRADNGVEVKFPTELPSEEGAIEFQHNADGSINIILRNLINRDQ